MERFASYGTERKQHGYYSEVAVSRSHGHGRKSMDTDGPADTTSSFDTDSDYEIRSTEEVSDYENRSTEEEMMKDTMEVEMSPLSSPVPVPAPTPKSTPNGNKDKRFGCRANPTCGKMFRDASTRTRHEKIHSPNRFPCKVCGVEYSRKDNRNRHEIRCNASGNMKRKVFRKTNSAIRTRDVAMTGIPKIKSPGAAKNMKRTKTKKDTCLGRRRAYMVNGVLHMLGGCSQQVAELFGSSSVSRANSNSRSRPNSGLSDDSKSVRRLSFTCRSQPDYK